MTDAVIYRQATGEIVGISSGRASACTPPDGCAAIDADASGGLGGKYIAGGVLAPRPAMPASLDKTSIQATGLDKATISAIPAGATAAVVDVNGRSDYTISDGLLEITADVAGEILVTLNLWPFLEARVEITAA